ncbi:hypothetical protein [Thalassospira xiamenensis]|uniref:Uncharacterized protein n=1 Tax=Thalassospira xiamenensis TaxID=220697 RepID=A0A285TS81_9PROT|nr:hypothetical protein [Thalassospira xiamenensis]SOC26653.1 hypothetical protein SAMN05428964_105156 [Thalassospira xiamenensis]
MNNNRKHYRELQSSDEIHGYFAKCASVVSALKSLCKLSDAEQVWGCTTSAELDVVSHYVDLLGNMMRLLLLKYAYTSYLSDDMQQKLAIDVSNGGMPYGVEVRRLENDFADLCNKDVPWHDYRGKIVDYILVNKSIPRHLQNEMAQQTYRHAVKQGRFMKTFEAPTVSAIGTPDSNGVKYAFIHWALYDTSRCMPVIYIMVAEDSSRSGLVKDDVLKETLSATCESYSQSALKLLTVATGIDEKLAFLHPKQLMRISLGSFSSSDFPEKENSISPLLQGFSENPSEDWVFEWKVEILRSLGSETNKDGMFSGGKRTEVFDVNRAEHGANLSGASEVLRRVVVPHAVYQSLQQGDHPFAETPIYVVGKSGHVALHM